MVVYLVAVIVPNKALAIDLKIAVASNFRMVLEDIVKRFHDRYPDINIVVISGSSGKLYAQIKYGAPFDVFLSADQDKVNRLIEDGLAISDSQITYALGSLILWSASPELVDNHGHVLLENNFNKLALANSKLAPYGFAAEQVLQHMGLGERTRSKWVKAENIAQAYQYIETGNASIGFIAQAQVWQNGTLSKGSMWKIPDDFYSLIKQDAVILKRTKYKDSARLLIDFLQRTSIRKLIEDSGYQFFREDN